MKSTFTLKNNKGFTIVETLVAVAILMISIAGPLTIAQKGLTAAIYARDQVTATYLAQDAMEIIKNERDNSLDTPDNPEGFSTWVGSFSRCDSEADKCSAQTYPGTPSGQILSASPCLSNCVLYLSNQGGYTTSNSGTPSQFSRGFYIKRLPQGNLNYANEATAYVSVTWTNGTVANAVTLEYELFNVIR